MKTSDHSVDVGLRFDVQMDSAGECGGARAGSEVASGGSNAVATMGLGERKIGTMIDLGS